MTEPTEAERGEAAMRLAEEVLFEGTTIADARGLGPDELEAMYTVGFNLYQQAQYADADQVFRLLCMLNHFDKRFWLGLGAARQMLKRYDDAVEAYAAAAILDVDDPRASLHAAECFIAAGKLEEASNSIDATLHFAGADAKHDAVRKRAEVLRGSVARRRKEG